MMAGAFTYQPVLVIDSMTLERSTDAVGYFLDDVDGTPQPIYDLNLSPIGSIPSSDEGITPVFKADLPYGFLIFGLITLPVVSVEAYAAVTTAYPASQAAADAAADAAAAAAAAQAAQQAAEAAVAGGGGGGGLSITELETRLGGSTGATDQLIPKLLMPYGKVNGLWPPRPTWGGFAAMAIGTTPGPVDLMSGDVYVEIAT